MPFVLVDKEHAEQHGIRHNYEDVNAGIYKDDNIHVVVRPLTELERRRYEDQINDIREEGKSMRPSTLARKQEKIVKDRIQASVIGWGGILDEHGQEVPYSWEALNQAFEQNPDFFRFVMDAVLDPYSETRKIRDAEKN